MIFRSSIIERIAMKAPLYSIETKYVDPKGTTNSLEHNELMKKYRLDKHTASAYLIALRGLKHQRRQTSRTIMKIKHSNSTKLSKSPAKGEVTPKTPRKPAH
jgi:hypothetical protein